MNLLDITTTSDNNNNMSKDTIQLINVWQHNLVEEMHNMMQIASKYKVIAMDTEFPGVVVHPSSSASDVMMMNSTSPYDTLRTNVNLLKMIQLGICFTDEYGNVPEDGRCCWQFHFSFDLEKDIFSQESIQLLMNSGMDFERHKDEGIDPILFGELLISSGIIYNQEMKWLSFHGGYDFGYLMKMIINCELPQDERMFFGLLHMHFPNIMDLKCIMRCIEGLKGGLNQLGSDLSVQRIGNAHQAGSDSLLTSACYFRMLPVLIGWDMSGFNGVLYGLGTDSYYYYVQQHHNQDSVCDYSEPESPSSPTPASTIVDTNWPQFRYSSASQKNRKKKAHKKTNTSNRPQQQRSIVNKCY